MAKAEKIKKFAYTQANMLAALQDVSKGMPVATAAKQHQVPRITLLYKSKGRTPVERRMGPPSILTQEEENELVIWTSTLCEAGFPVTKADLLNYVQRLVRKLNRPNPFTEDRPGKSWYQNFLKRNPCITSRIRENLTLSRADVNKESLGKWFSNMYSYLDENGFAFILNEPERLFNCDETGFLLNPKDYDVLTLKGRRSTSQTVNNSNKENITVFLTGNAAGQLIPPMIVFKYEDIPKEIIDSVPETWSVGRSESGWMTSDIFYEFLANLFVPWLRENNIELPVILFTDGHASHLSLETSRFCQHNHIVLIALHPNTHMLQPVDVSVFKTLKANWTNKVIKWRYKMGNPTLDRKDFAPLLEDALTDITPEIVSSGFKKTGLYPWNPDAPLRQSSNDTHSQNSNNTSRNHLIDIRDRRIALEVLEKYIAPEKLAKFKQTNACIVTEDKSLYEIWKKISTVVPIENTVKNSLEYSEVASSSTAIM